LYNGQEAIVFKVHKQADAQLFALKTKFKELLTAFRADYPELHFEITNDQSTLLTVAIQNLQSSLLYGAFFAFIILFLFFWEWQTPLLIGLVIPSSLIISILIFYLTNLSINIISLSGLDNSIIVIENIRQYQKMGHSIAVASVSGPNEVIRPLISSALTTCSVFLPLIFLSGIGGALFYDQALSISIALGVSLLIAYILLPTLVRLLSREKKERATKNTEKKANNNPFKFYTKTVDYILKYRWFTLVFFGLFTFMAIGQLSEMEQETFPKLSRDALTIKIDWNEAIGMATNETRMNELIAHVGTTSYQHTISLGAHQFLLNPINQSINESEAIFYSTRLL